MASLIGLFYARVQPVIEPWSERARQAHEAQALLADSAQATPEQTLGRHWTRRAWSRVLDAEVWFVCCEQEVAQLDKQGIQRANIYTEAELVELLRLPQRPSAETLKSLHAVKSYFDATVVSPSEPLEEGGGTP